MDKNNRESDIPARYAPIGREGESPKKHGFLERIKNRLSNVPKAVCRAGIPIALILATSVLFPTARTIYQRGSARNILHATSAEIGKLEGKVKETQKVYERSLYLLTDEERTSQISEIEQSRDIAGNLRAEMKERQEEFERGNYNRVREKLDSGFSGNGKDTLIDITAREINDMTKVIKFCEGKKSIRNEVWNNELFLVARLKSPYYHEKMLEKDERLSLLPKELFDLVPVLNAEFESQLRELSPSLFNSMGANLLKHKPKLEHMILNGRTKRVKDAAQNMYDEAIRAYLPVGEMNGVLVWYRPGKHDGKVNVKGYSEILEGQRRTIAEIKKGDESLSKLDSYYDELHKQRFSYVSGHKSVGTQFAHTGIRTVPRLGIDADGDLELRMETETYTYYNPGYKYFFSVSSVSPHGESCEDVYVGEREGNKNWDYPRNQQAGYVIEWKRLHDDNQGIVRSGLYSELKPRIEKEQE